MIARMAKRLETVSLAVPMAALLGLALAFALFAMPGWWLGRAVAASGLPALIHAATPPLGHTARLLIAGAGGLAGALPVWALFTWLERPMPIGDRTFVAERDDAELVDAADDAAPAVPSAAALPFVEEAPLPTPRVIEPLIEDEPVGSNDRISAAVVAAGPSGDAPAPVSAPQREAGAAVPPTIAPIAETAQAGTPAAGTSPVEDPAQARPWLRWLPTAIFARRAEPAADGAPTLRRADAHPDAPARRPIFASADLGAPLDAGGAAWSADAWSGQDAAPAAPLLLDAAWQTRRAEPLSPPRATIRAADTGEQASAAALMARLEAALAAKPGRPASPPAQGEALREAMAELRRTRMG